MEVNHYPNIRKKLLIVGVFCYNNISITSVIVFFLRDNGSNPSSNPSGGPSGSPSSKCKDGYIYIYIGILIKNALVG
jgi:hypothetical protein